MALVRPSCRGYDYLGMSGSGTILDGHRLHQDGAFKAEQTSYDVYLTGFDPRYAEAIVGWVRDERELLWLAPGTPPPLTVQKVLDWSKERRRRQLFWRVDQSSPTGYAELNEMPGVARQMWVGHFLVDPSHRLHGLGTQFAQALVLRAFLEFGADDLLLVVFPENTRAIRCYERAGLVVLGKEKKLFESTGREHTFLRMGLERRRFMKLATKGMLPARPVPYRDLRPEA